MELVAILRVLLRHRVLVVLGALLAVAAGAALMLQGKTSTGVVTVRVQVRAPESRTVNLESDVARTLAARASLLADLLATESVRSATERDAGVPPGELAISTPAMGAFPTVPVPIAVRARQAAARAASPTRSRSRPGPTSRSSPCAPRRRTSPAPSGSSMRPRRAWSGSSASARPGRRRC